MACNYYSRARFIDNLMPQLNEASSSEFGSRIISVLSAGQEGQLNMDDLDLKKTYSLANAKTHAVTFNTAAFQVSTWSTMPEYMD